MFSHNNIREGYLISTSRMNSCIAHIALYGRFMATQVRMILLDGCEGVLLLLFEKE